MPVHERVQALEIRGQEINDEWVREIRWNSRFIWLKNVPEWRLRAFGLAVLNRLTCRLSATQEPASKVLPGFGHLRFRQWVPVCEIVGCLLVLRREIFASAGVLGGCFLDPDSREFRARVDTFFDDFIAWQRWEQE